MVVHAKSAEPTEMPFWVWTQMGPRKPVLGGSLYPSGERQFFFGGGYFLAHCKYREYNGCCWSSQLHLVDDSRNAACQCQLAITTTTINTAVIRETLASLRAALMV